MKGMEGNDLALVEQARAGDSDAFRELVETYSQPIFRTAYRLTGTQENAEDVVQEAFLRAYRKLHLFDGRSQFGTWLHRIAVNCAMDLMRREGRRAQRETAEERVQLEAMTDGDPSPDRLAESSEIGRAVEKVLKSLSPTERAAFLLRHFEGRSSIEVGRILGIRAGASRNAVFRAVRKLRAALDPLLEEGHEISHG
jgi:RNA polymerase sigma-70 factor (ECF subfamily)